MNPHPVSALRIRDRSATTRFHIGVAAGLLALFAGGCAPHPTGPAATRPDAIGALSTPIEPRQEDADEFARRRVVVRLVEQGRIEEIAEAYRVKVLDSEPELNLHLVATSDTVGEQTLAAILRADARVVFAELDFAVQSAEGRQSSMAFDEGFRPFDEVLDQTALRRVGIPAAHAVARGRGVLIAILDTGVDLDHPVLAGRLDLPGIEPGRTVDAADDRADGVDSNRDGVVDGSRGHGTHVAGIAAAIAPDARILAVRVLDSDGVGYSFQVARGIVAAVLRGARVVNLSLGMPVPSLAVASALDLAIAAGCLVTAPAGNAGEAGLEFPAAHPPVLAVAATDAMDRKATFSNYDPAVDLSAPGTGILSTYFDGRCATWSGTSMAAPFVAGVAALVAESAPPSPAGALQVIDRLRDGALSLATLDPAHAEGLGAGRISATGSLSQGSGALGEPEPAPLRSLR